MDVMIGVLESLCRALDVNATCFLEPNRCQMYQSSADASCCREVTSARMFHTPSQDSAASLQLFTLSTGMLLLFAPSSHGPID